MTIGWRFDETQSCWLGSWQFFGGWHVWEDALPPDFSLIHLLRNGHAAPSSHSICTWPDHVLLPIKSAFTHPSCPRQLDYPNTWHLDSSRLKLRNQIGLNTVASVPICSPSELPSTRQAQDPHRANAEGFGGATRDQHWLTQTQQKHCRLGWVRLMGWLGRVGWAWDGKCELSKGRRVTG